MEKRIVYADNAATTRMSYDALLAAKPFFCECFANASSTHSPGMIAAKAVLAARQKTAAAIGAKVSEIYFTSGATESDNWAITSACENGARQGKRHIVTTSIEHHAVINTCKSFEDKGFEVTYLPVGSSGIVNVKDLSDAIREDTCLVSVMYVNNEIGTIQPVPEIAALCRERGILFHTDAVQAVGQFAIDVEKQNIDMLSLSGHKFHAMKGVGALYVRSGVRLESLIKGGAQEKGRRAGTENVPAIVTLGAAIESITSDITDRNDHIRKLRDELTRRILSEISGTHLNGDKDHRVSGNVNITFDDIEGESMLMMLDMKGICASSGSACASGSLEPSHVLTAIGLTREQARGSIRFTLNEENTYEDIDYIMHALSEITDKLRALRT